MSAALGNTAAAPSSTALLQELERVRALPNVVELFGPTVTSGSFIRGRRSATLKITVAEDKDCCRVAITLRGAPACSKSQSDQARRRRTLLVNEAMAPTQVCLTQSRTFVLQRKDHLRTGSTHLRCTARHARRERKVGMKPVCQACPPLRSSFPRYAWRLNAPPFI